MISWSDVREIWREGGSVRTALGIISVYVVVVVAACTWMVVRVHTVTISSSGTAFVCTPVTK